ncbi:MAG: sigma-70 family RNA polymerase sigma factor, partial [Verrucomicrobiota bacterium]
FQETFIKVHVKSHSFNSGARFKTWLYRIATNHAIDGFRKRRREMTVLVDDPDDAEKERQASLEPGEASPAEQLVRSERIDRVKQAIEALPPQQRAALVLSYYQGLTYTEVSTVLKCSTGTVKTHMSRAMQTLSRVLSGEKGELNP